MEAWRIPDNKVINMWEYFVFGNEYLKKEQQKHMNTKKRFF